MSSFEEIIEKLEKFIKRYYSKRLLQGLVLFTAGATFLFLMVSGVEYWLWLDSKLRLALFVVFLVLLVVLSYTFILVPLSYLFKIKKGINEKDASLLIGKHFPEVGDKLLNLLELSENPSQTDLLKAAIEQRSLALKPLPFKNAIDFKEVLKYGRFLLVPALIFIALVVTGSIGDLFGSYKRVVNYSVAYEEPAPFKFYPNVGDWRVLEGEPLDIRVETIGSYIPLDVYLETGQERLLMKKEGNNAFSIRVQPPFDDFSFRFSANEVASKEYFISVRKVPAIADFKIAVQEPNYLGGKTSVTTGTGNIKIPEGSKVRWNIRGVNVSQVHFYSKDSIEPFVKTAENFTLEKQVFNAMEYVLTTSNENVRRYEKLGYTIDVIKDAVPTIKVEQTIDSLQINESYYSGTVSDDYGIASIVLEYKELGSNNEKRELLLNPTGTIEQFYYTFPSGIAVEEGKTYELYFEVRDNDGLRNGKIAKSERFFSTLLDDKEQKDKTLENQESLIKDLGNSIRELDLQNKELEELNEQQKQETALQFKDKERIKRFLQKQKSQEALMEKFTKELRENLDKDRAPEEVDEFLKERLERQELAAKRNQKLLEELEKVADKIDKEELKQRLEELAKSQNSGKRNLEQLLELTKRFYVTEKASQLSQELLEQSKVQDSLVASEKNVEEQLKEQEELNKDFENLADELRELKGDNRALKKPLEFDFNRNTEESIKRDQQGALEDLDSQQKAASDADKKGSQNSAKNKQRSAAQKLEELSKKLEQSSAASGGGEGMVEDAEMLRQILDNLITFSFKQENLLDRVNQNSGEVSGFSRTIKEQKQLRALFEHVDDSLFALSLRRAELSEFVNEQITEVYYNVDKSLETIAENQIYQAASYQQYVLNSSNALADFLADILENMQMSMNSGQGQGQGQGFQLPDIIQSQQELQEKMQGSSGQGGKSGNSEGQESKGGKGSKGDQGQQKGQQGNQGQEGQEGANGDGGKNGKTGKNGEGSGGEQGQENGEGGSEGFGGVGELSEGQLNELYEIYQEQQAIRRQLEEQLKNIIENEERALARKLVYQMEQFENELLENGITQRTQNRMNQIQHQLMKLENAALEQGKKKERESETNTKDYSAPILTRPELLAPTSKTIEILNRQALPLRPQYKDRVKQYFGGERQF